MRDGNAAVASRGLHADRFRDLVDGVVALLQQPLRREQSLRGDPLVRSRSGLLAELARKGPFRHVRSASQIVHAQGPAQIRLYPLQHWCESARDRQPDQTVDKLCLSAFAMRRNYLLRADS